MNEPPRFLDRPANLRRMRRLFYVLCAALVGLEAVVHRHVEHPWEGAVAFYAGFGFVACVVLVLAATQLRRLLMRREDFYDPPARRAARPAGEQDES